MLKATRPIHAQAFGTALFHGKPCAPAPAQEGSPSPILFVVYHVPVVFLFFPVPVLLAVLSILFIVPIDCHVLVTALPLQKEMERLRKDMASASVTEQQQGGGSSQQRQQGQAGRSCRTLDVGWDTVSVTVLNAAMGFVPHVVRNAAGADTAASSAGLPCWLCSVVAVTPIVLPRR
jgi:hypothetical protein